MDQLKHISFEQAVRATGLTDGEWGQITGLANIAGAATNGRGATVTEALVQAVSVGKVVPVNVVIARPFIEHLMMSCVACLSGRDTGATLFGPADMQISANTSVKTIEGT